MKVDRHTMSTWPMTKECLRVEKDRIVTPGVSTLFQVGCTARDDMLKGFSFKAEKARIGLRNRSFIEILYGCKGVIQE